MILAPELIIINLYSVKGYPTCTLVQGEAVGYKKSDRGTWNPDTNSEFNKQSCLKFCAGNFKSQFMPKNRTVKTPLQNERTVR